MADAKEAAKAEKPAGGGGGKKMLLGLLIGVVVAGGGATGAFLFLGKKAGASEGGKDGAGDGHAKKDNKHKKSKKSQDPGPIEKLNPFVVNLRDPQTTRYLKTTLEFELGHEKEVEKFKKYGSAIRHEVLMYLSGLSVAEIQGEGGRQIIARELLAKVRKIYESGEVRNLFITEFVVQ